MWPDAVQREFHAYDGAAAASCGAGEPVLAVPPFLPSVPPRWLPVCLTFT